MVLLSSWAVKEPEAPKIHSSRSPVVPRGHRPSLSPIIPKLNSLRNYFRGFIDEGAKKDSRPCCFAI